MSRRIRETRDFSEFALALEFYLQKGGEKKEMQWKCNGNQDDRNSVAELLTSYVMWLNDAVLETPELGEMSSLAKGELKRIAELWKALLQDDLDDEFSEESSKRLQGIEQLLIKLS